ncbi:MAG: glycosyltransferase family 2 protein [Candidatus Kerfeldbacteria bacterium]|nr:glycosyltransferase family 2 protein [Candidatus Kerfeldbacteria bacterium]
MLKISIVVPAWNEEHRIGSTLRDILQFLMQKGYAGQESEILVVDDGSTDRTRAVVDALHDPRIQILGDGKNHGKGWAVRTGIAEAKGEWILVMDADSSTRISEVLKLLKHQREADAIIGSRALAESRILESQSQWKVMLGRFGNRLIQLLLLPGIKDTQCGFKLYSSAIRPILTKLTIDGWGSDFELLFVAKKHGLRIREVPVQWKNDTRSKVRPSGYLKTFRDLLRVRLNDARGIYSEHHGKKESSF